jgi:multidrug efflux pump
VPARTSWRPPSPRLWSGSSADGAARDVEAAINSARSYLPANLPSNPTYRKVNPADSPIMIVGLTSNVFSQGQMYDYASTIMAQRISQIQGVGQVAVGGSSSPAVRVEANPTLLNSFGQSLSGIESLLRLQNTDVARGQITNGAVTADIIDNGQINHASDYKELIVGNHNGTAVRLRDVADVVDSVSNLRNAGYMDGKPSVTLIIFRQPGANIIQTVDRIRASLPALKASLPAGIDTTLVLDRTTTIRASVSTVQQSLVISIILVVLVVFVFLRNLRGTLIPSVAVPTSLIGTFAVMYLFGYSLDNLSLMALTIATGFVVDDAIVVMENISRHLEDGMQPFAAALQGAREIGFTVLTISLSLIAVFIPILAMGGIVGRLFREFAVTLSAAIVVSMIVSLTTTPMMCAHVLKPHDPSKENWLYKMSERGFNGMLNGYRSSLTWVLENPGLVLVVLILTIALNVVLVIRVPKGFFPQEDTGVIFGGLLGPQDSSFPAMDDSVKAIVNVIKADPAVEHVNAYTGTGNGGFIFIALKPLNQRKGSDATTVINRLRPKMNRLPVASAFLQAAQDVRTGGRASSAQYQYTIQSDTLEDLSKWGPILLAKMKTLPGITDANSDQQNGGLQAYLTYDRTKAAQYGLTPSSLDSTLYSAFGQSEASTIYTQLNQYYVILEVAPQYWQSPHGLKDVYLQSSNGHGTVPLITVATNKINTTPLQVNHTGPSVTISFNLAPGFALSDATRAIQKMQSDLGTPPTIYGSFGGTAAAYQDSMGSELVLIITALLTVYIVLGILYESLVHPITIISTLPSASVGAMLALMLFKVELDVISIIGIVLLIGIVKKNAIMMIDFALMAEREQGLTTEEAIFQACMLRFRPIMMTTMAALFGALPLAFGTGMGSELRRPLGITIVGGLIMSQLLTLYTTPVIYLYLDRFRLWVMGKEHDSLEPMIGEAS